MSDWISFLLIVLIACLLLLVENLLKGHGPKHLKVYDGPTEGLAWGHRSKTTTYTLAPGNSLFVNVVYGSDNNLMRRIYEVRITGVMPDNTVAVETTAWSNDAI